MLSLAEGAALPQGLREAQPGRAQGQGDTGPVPAAPAGFAPVGGFSSALPTLRQILSLV